MKRLIVALLCIAAGPYDAEERNWAQAKSRVVSAAVMRGNGPIRGDDYEHWIAVTTSGVVIDSLEIVRKDGSWERRSCDYTKDGSKAVCRFFRKNGRIDVRTIAFDGEKWSFAD